MAVELPVLNLPWLSARVTVVVSLDLIGLLAIRLAYDVALAKAPGIPWPLALWPADVTVESPPTDDVLARYALQVAAEQVYRRELLQKLATRSATPQTSTRKRLQMVFCIDVRSEVIRRNLESMNESIETFGFAGFFGMPLEYVPFGFATGTPQCPVLLQPSFQVHERLRGIHAAQNLGLNAQRRIELAEGMLRNLGLTSGFARVVALCGHASDVTNNPYRAALDCGACGGHSGEPNARVSTLDGCRSRYFISTRLGISVR